MLRFMDGFNAMATADIPLKWSAYNNSVINSTGRFSGNCLRCGGGAYATKTIDVQSTWIVGFALRIDSLFSATILQILDGGSLQVDVRMNADGTLTVTRNGTTLGSSTAALATNIWYYLEFKVVISSTTGTVELRLNGASVVGPLVSQNTQATANPSANMVKLLNSAFGGTCDFDDVYILDGQASAAGNNTFLGDMRVEALLPTANGNYAAWTNNGGASAHASVADNPEDGDTSYISDSVAGDQSTFTYAPLSGNPSKIQGIQIAVVARIDDAGPHTIAPMLRIAATDYVEATTPGVSATYNDYLSIQEQNPHTSANWTLTDINAIEAGVKLVS